MSNGRVRAIPDRRAWDEFLCTHDGHLLQTFEWGELKSHFGWQPLRLGVEANGRLVAAAQMLLRRAPLFTFAYVPRGPTLSANESGAASALVNALLDAARKQNAMILKLEPNATILDDWMKELGALGFVPSRDTIQPQTTVHLDLTRPLETTLAAMKPKWRYNIRLASKKGIVVRESGPADLPRIYELLRVTGARDQFAVHSFPYYQHATELLADRACWFVATYENEIIAAIFVTAFGAEAIYLYGASDNSQRDKMPNHALHWSALQWAKARGCAHYDWWGIPDAANAEDERLPEGLSRFKQGFGGEVVHYVGACERVIRPWHYKLYKQLLRVRRGMAVA